ncbi:MAG TPA: translation elongation factor Ts [Gemmatimonadales bacterium]|nr:translation elongation factor Ts [Gemmatimonadales bacterium]
MSTKTVSPKQISELRARTGAGMMDCKAALEEAGGDLDKAVEILRKKGIAKADKRGGRTASQGLIVISAEDLGFDLAMIELNCETDFVARTEGFIQLARELGVHAALHAPLGIHEGSVLDAQPFAERTVGEAVKELAGKTGEATTLRRVAHFRQENGTVQGYLHHNGQVGVLIELEGPPGDGLDALGRELALHIASADPLAISDADIPAETLERERRIAEEQVAAEGKPEQIRAKIVDGKLRKFVAERTLLGQSFVKDESKTAGDLLKEAAKSLGGPVTVKRFARFRVGEA